jgi:23S rRNA (cytidine1920-2'-O)/16S rRNA (cytidine1409-2'-O)-methyltransferase
VTRRRLDAELVRRGLAPSRAAAQEAVDAGIVRVDGRVAVKVATMVADDTAVDLLSGARPYVSRGGSKLAAALDRFGIDPAGCRCLDAGASTGGFTDVLLQRGAAHVLAVDVSYGQLAWSLRTDPRVTVLERTNVRDLEGGSLPYAAELVVVDVSFISLGAVLPNLARLAAPDVTFVVLVKPQFEAARADVGRGGVVRDPEIWGRVLRDAIDGAAPIGLRAEAVMASPLLGPAGNVEFLLQLARRLAPTGGDIVADVDAAVRAGEELIR